MLLLNTIVVKEQQIHNLDSSSRAEI